jgi:hypothetical protein
MGVALRGRPGRRVTERQARRRDALLFDALLEIIDDEKSDFVAEYGDGTAVRARSGSPTPDGPAVAGDPVFMLTALAEHLKKTPDVFKSLRVQSGNGSSSTEQENNMDEKQIKKAAEDHLRARLAPFAKQLGLADDADVLAEIVKRLPAGSTVATRRSPLDRRTRW